MLFFSSFFKLLISFLFFLELIFIYDRDVNIKNTRQVYNNNQQLTIVRIHAKIEICSVIIYNYL